MGTQTHTCRGLADPNGSRVNSPKQYSTRKPVVSSSNGNSCGKITRSRYSIVLKSGAPKAEKAT
jgi:hypothetical protein